jgi:hypothetical protein
VFERGPQTVLGIEVDGASQGLEQPLVRVLGVTSDLPGGISSLLVERGLVEVGFEELDERFVSVGFIGGGGRVADASGSIRGGGVGVRVGVFVLGVGVLLDRTGLASGLLGLDGFGAHQGQEMDVGVADRDAVDRVGAEHDRVDVAGQL